MIAVSYLSVTRTSSPAAISNSVSFFNYSFPTTSLFSQEKKVRVKRGGAQRERIIQLRSCVKMVVQLSDDIKRKIST